MDWTAVSSSDVWDVTEALVIMVPGTSKSEEKQYTIIKHIHNYCEHMYIIIHAHILLCTYIILYMYIFIIIIFDQLDTSTQKK